MEREAHPADFMQSLRPGRRITFYELPEKIENKTVSLALPEKAVLFFWMPLPVEKRRGNFLKDPVVMEFSQQDITKRMENMECFSRLHDELCFCRGNTSKYGQSKVTDKSPAGRKDCRTDFAGNE